MSKGIVMELTARHIVVMTQDGMFERIPRLGRACRIGEEITYTVSKRAWKMPAVLSSVAAAAVFFCVLVLSGLPSLSANDDVVAYISMDINPSVEIGIDNTEKVLVLKGLNEDGEQLIETVTYKGKTLEQVAEELLNHAESKVLSKGEADIVIASSRVDENSQVDDEMIASRLKDQVNEHIKKTHPDQQGAYVVTAFAAPPEVREAAKQDGLSMGKYALYLNLKSNGTPVELEQFKEESIHKIAEKNEAVRKSINEKLPTKTDIKKLLEAEKSGNLDQGKGQGSKPQSTITPSSFKDRDKSEEERRKQEAEERKKEEQRKQEELRKKQEEQRKADARKKEEERKREELRKKQQEEARKREEERKKLEEARKKEEARLKEEDARKKEEERKKEEARKKEEEDRKKKEEEDRKKNEQNKSDDSDKRDVGKDDRNDGRPNDHDDNRRSGN